MSQTRPHKLHQAWSFDTKGRRLSANTGIVSYEADPSLKAFRCTHTKQFKRRLRRSVGSRNNVPKRVAKRVGLLNKPPSVWSWSIQNKNSKRSKVALNLSSRNTMVQIKKQVPVLTKKLSPWVYKDVRQNLELVDVERKRTLKSHHFLTPVRVQYVHAFFFQS